jgi:arylsulfatase A-like enzyme
MRRIYLLMLVAMSAAAATPPNFVFILADDQAWNGLSKRMIREMPESGSDYHLTPNIDRLASEGMTFSRAYAPAPKCEPSRYAIMFGMTTASLNAPDKRTAAHLRTDTRPSLANALKQANPAYRTATFGKWQLVRSQSELGFDRDDGKITQNQDGESPDPRDPKRMFELTDKGNRFIEDSVKSGSPFYLQLWHYAVHGSNQSLPETLGRWQSRTTGRRHRDPTRAAMAEDFDRAVGRTLAKIDELGIRDHTYVIYMSDNGGPTRYLRGGKTNVTEGGLKVPLVVRGPGIAQDQYCDTPVVGYDLLPTVLDFAVPGTVPPPGTEGGSWKPLLLSACEQPVERPIDRLVFFFADGGGRDPGPHAAIVKGNYKLLYSWPNASAALFDVSEDMRETSDLSDGNPDLAMSLRQELMDHLRAGIGDAALARAEAGDTPDSRAGRERPQRRNNPRPRAQQRRRERER